MITLHNIHGISKLAGQDSNGNWFTEFYVDYLAEEEDGECAECGKTLDMGWLCLDGGEEFCFDHIEFCPQHVNHTGQHYCEECERLEESNIRS